jgi:hypothetical protein
MFSLVLLTPYPISMKYPVYFSFQLLIVLCVLSVLSGACKKKEIQGPKGEPGTPGKGGNSDISNTGIFPITSTQWIPNPDSSALEVKINTSLITKDVVDKGGVKAFVLEGTAWYELPFSTRDLFMQYGFEEGSVKFVFSNIHGGLPIRPSTTNFRIMILSESARAQTGAVENIPALTGTYDSFVTSK